MDSSGEAAERLVRISLDGVHYAVKIAGPAAKHLAVLLLSSLNGADKTSGQMRLSAMLKTGKALKVFTLTEAQLVEFAKEARRYGVTYCALRDKTSKEGSFVEVMCKAEDSSKIQRIFERLQFAKIEDAKIDPEIEKEEIREDPQDRPFGNAARPFPPSNSTSEKPGTEDKAQTTKNRKSVRQAIAEIRAEREVKSRKNRKPVVREDNKSFSPRKPRGRNTR
jgi:hypothetical protein